MALLGIVELGDAFGQYGGEMLSRRARAELRLELLALAGQSRISLEMLSKRWSNSRSLLYYFSSTSWVDSLLLTQGDEKM
jgi:hypothetical protein